MKKYCIIILCLIQSFYSNAQENEIADTVKAPKKLEEVIVYANKFPETIKKIAHAIKVIKDPAQINFNPTIADVLINSGNVFVQKSQQGGGSPVIRGFEASRVLLMVDGVRMNNAIYRSGHLQNIITVDNMILDRIEIIYGPSSTLYGSDALGGVVNLYTRNPLLIGDQFKLKGNITSRYASAADEKRIHADLNYGKDNWSFITSYTHSSFGDLKQGSKRRIEYPDFGKVNFIVGRINGIDSAISTTNVNIQGPAGYEQEDFLQKILFQPKPGIQHLLNIQVSNSGNIPRYDRLSEFNTSTQQPNFAEWFYGPQKRNLLSYHFTGRDLSGFFQQVKAVVSYQDIEESRFSRRFRNNVRQERIENINVWGISLDAKKFFGRNELNAGFDMQANYLRSTARGVNITNGNLNRISTRYPDGPNQMSYVAAYAQHTFKINPNLTLIEGLRITQANLHSVFADTSLMHFPFSEAKQDNLNLSGNLGLVYSTDSDLRIAALASTGFRSPNIDDLGKVFDSRTGIVIVPNPDIKPENTYNFELNFNKFHERYSVGASVFYTLFTNALVTDRFTFNGMDSIMFNGVKSAVLANQNKNRAFLYGYSVNGKVEPLKNLIIDGTYTYSFGRFKNLDNSRIPLDHIPPAYGKAGINYTLKNWKTDASILFNGWKRIKDFNPGGEDNPQFATIDGMPSWTIFNFKLSYTLKKQLTVEGGIENIFDLNYRYFASGISAAGRNYSIGIRGSF